MPEFEASEPFLDFLCGQLLPDSLEGIKIFPDFVTSPIFLDFDGSADFGKIGSEKKGERLRISFFFRFEIHFFE